MDKLRILCIDDEPEILILLNELLSEHYQVLTLDNPELANDAIELFQPDMVIVDLMMPRIDGYQIIRLIKGNDETSQINVMIFSAKDTPEEMKEGLAHGADCFLTKPLHPDKFRKSVEKIMEGKAPRLKRRTIEEVHDKLEQRFEMWKEYEKQVQDRRRQRQA